MEIIHGEPKLLSYNPGGPGWSADIHVKQRKFRLSSEYGYIAVEEILDGSFRSLMPPQELRTNISLLQVAELVNAECA
jgi:hypothetical protein